MAGLVPDLDGHVVPAVALDRVARRQHREEVQDLGLALEGEAAPRLAVHGVLPLPLQVAGDHGDLVGGGAGAGGEADPVGVLRDVVALAPGGVVQVGHARPGGQAPLAAIVVVAHLHALEVAEHRQIGAVHERPVAHRRGVGAAVLEATRRSFQIELQIGGGPGGQRRRQLEGVELQPIVGLGGPVQTAQRQRWIVVSETRFTYTAGMAPSLLLVSWNRPVIRRAFRSGQMSKCTRTSVTRGCGSFSCCLYLRSYSTCSRLSCLRGLVLVEDVGVVEDERAGGGEAQDDQRHHPPGAAARPLQRQPQPLAEPGVLAARPQQIDSSARATAASDQ